MPSRRTKTRSAARTRRGIEREPSEFGAPGLESAAERVAGEERSEPGGRAERGAGDTPRAAPADPLAGRELSREPIDEALDRARLRSALEPPGGGRISAEVIDE